MFIQEVDEGLEEVKEEGEMEEEEELDDDGEEGEDGDQDTNEMMITINTDGEQPELVINDPSLEPTQMDSNGKM